MTKTPIFSLLGMAHFGRIWRRDLTKSKPLKCDNRLTFQGLCAIISVTILGHHADFHRCHEIFAIRESISGFIFAPHFPLKLRRRGLLVMVYPRLLVSGASGFALFLRSVILTNGRSGSAAEASGMWRSQNAFGCVPPRLSTR